VLKGDLTTTPIDIALAALADEAATGCLHVVDDEGSEALIYLKSGLIYAVSVPGQRPQLGARLISSNVLVPENLAEALEAQRTELQGWRLGELLVHLGLVEQEVVEAFVQEQVRDGFTDLMAWTSGRWRFRKAEKTREDVGPPTPLDELLGEVRRRQQTWTDIVSSVHGPNAVPMLAARGGEADVTLDSDTWSLLCKIDGERSIADLARECGFTLFEAGTVVRALVEAGLVDVEEDVGPDGDPLDVEFDSDDGAAGAAGAADEVEDEAEDESEEEAPASDRLPRTAALAAAFALSGKDIPPAKDSPSHATSDQPFSIEELHEWDVARSVGDEGVSTLAQVSEALTKALGPRKESANAFVDPFHVPDEIRLRAAPKIASAPAEFSEEQLRRDRLRQAAAAELAAAHAEAEAMHSITKDASKVGHIAQVVDLEARRGAARAEAQRREAERVEAEEAARVEAERIAADDEAARLEAERVAAEEAARVEAERIAAEKAAARLEAERITAEEAARAEAERIAAEEEAARLEAERIAAEEAARAEAERVAAEEEAARLEAARIAAEEEAARLEAERIAAEEEAARIAAEEEAARIAAEEEAARLEAERVAAEEEAARIAAEEEAARIAAEEEAARVEAERVAAEEEAARIAAEEEAARIAAEEEAARMAAEDAARTDAERAAAEEVARIAAEEQAARVEAERVEAERVEAERVEAERVEAERLEAERVAAEEAAANASAQEEAARVESERLDAERIAAEEAARFAAEQEVARIAADELARTEEESENAAREARSQFAAAQAAAEEAAAFAAEDEARKAAELAESERIEAVNQMMAHASAPTADPRHFASANAMLSEFSRNGATTLESTDEEPEQAPEYEPMPAPVASRDLADTASLLRELSSLGFEDEPPAPAGPRPGASTPGPSAPRPVTTSAAQKKKRGLFGR